MAIRFESVRRRSVYGHRRAGGQANLRRRMAGRCHGTPGITNKELKRLAGVLKPLHAAKVPLAEPATGQPIRVAIEAVKVGLGEGRTGRGGDLSDMDRGQLTASGLLPRAVRRQARREGEEGRFTALPSWLVILLRARAWLHAHRSSGRSLFLRRCHCESGSRCRHAKWRFRRRPE